MKKAMMILVFAVVGCAVESGPAPVDAGAAPDSAFPIGARDLGADECRGVNPTPGDVCWLRALDAGWDPCPRHCACDVDARTWNCDAGSM